MYHAAIIVEGMRGACGTKETARTRYEAEQRVSFLSRAGKLAWAESYDEQERVISLPSDIATRAMRLLYPDSL